MADLMGNSPAKVATAYIFTVIMLHRYRTAYQRRGIPFDTDMKAACVHKCACKHSLVTDV